MRRARHAVLLVLAFCALPGAVHAQNAFTARRANLRAGPDRAYPLVAQLAPGTPVQVIGCLDDWSWCDVGFDDTHGWVYAPSLSYVYDGSRVPLYSYAPSLGIPILTFSLGAYWDRYYRGRPWYSQRGEWEHRRIPHMRPPGPPPHQGPPPHAGPGRGPSLRGGVPPHEGPPAREGPGRAGPEHFRPGEPAQPGRPAPSRPPRQIRGRESAPQLRGPARGERPGNPGAGDHGRSAPERAHPPRGGESRRGDEGRRDQPH